MADIGKLYLIGFESSWRICHRPDLWLQRCNGQAVAWEGGGWKGATVAAVTTEYVGGVARRVTEKFRAYASHAESFADYARLIGNNPRYAASLRAGDAGQFAQSLQQAGYATDPNYAKKLTAVIAQTLRAVA